MSSPGVVDTSGFGLSVTVFASNTFPAGVTLTQFADDADPFDLPEIQVADAAVGLNGDLVSWSSAKVIEVALALIAGSEDDQNMAILLEANRVGPGKKSAQDVITVVAVYPSEKQLTLTPGKITAGMVGPSVASAGRMKAKSYKFKFANRTGGA